MSFFVSFKVCFDVIPAIELLKDGRTSDGLLIRERTLESKTRWYEVQSGSSVSDSSERFPLLLFAS